MVVVFKINYDLDGEKRTKNYYVNESVGIASGFLLAALHQSGLATLTHTPSPMGFLEKILKRPKNERAVLLIPVGYPAKDSRVPILKKKDMTLDQVVEFQVNEEILVRRITGRYSCADCHHGYHQEYQKPKVPGTCDNCGSTKFTRRSEDNEGTVRSRLIEYHTATAPIVDFYDDRGLLIRIDGMSEIELITEQLETIVR